MAKRFFNDDSFWNTPIPADAKTDPRSDEFIGMLKDTGKGAWRIGLERWTIPVYEVDDNTPRYRVKKRIHTEEDIRERGSKWVGVGHRFGHGPGFGMVPIPDNVMPDPEGDQHMAMVDWKNMVAWDMWGIYQLPDGSWESNTGMFYRLDGDGIFRTEDFSIVDGDSVHFHGPSRASGVPAIAGLIMYDDVAAGEINYKLACATPRNMYKEFVFPACWTDGYNESGLPEGTLIQLDPAVDIDAYDMLPGERAVAKALQKYGCVNTDNAGVNCLYGEGLWCHDGKNWDGLLRNMGGLDQIPLDKYQVIELGEVTRMGDQIRSGIGH